MKYVQKAAGEALTLDELRELVQLMEARQVPGRSVVRVIARLGGRAREISIDPDEQLIDKA